MKNLVLITNYPPPIGGVPGQVKNLIPFLESNNFNITIIAYNCNIINKSLSTHNISSKTQIFKYPKFRDINNIKSLLSLIFLFFDKKFFPQILNFSYISYSGLKKYLYNIITIQKINKLGIKPDLVVAYNIFSRGDLAFAISKYFNCKYVLYNFGELYVNYNLINNSFLKKIFLKNLVNNSEALFSCSKHCLDSYKLFSLNNKNEKVFYVPVNNDDYYLISNQAFLFEKYNIHKEKYTLTYFGRFCDELGFDIFINIIEHYLNDGFFHFHFIAMGMQEDLELEKKIRDLQFQFPKNISIYTNTSCQTSNELLNISNITLVLSRNIRACSSNVSAESMACGVPVIAFNNGGVSEIILNNKHCRLLKDNTTTELILNINEYYIKRKYYSNYLLKQEISEHVKLNFDISSINNNISNELKRLANL